MKNHGQRDRANKRSPIRDQRGAVAIEFAMVAVPFFLLLFIIFEQGIFFLKSQALQTAVSDSARLIATGKAKRASYTQEQFRQQVCSRLSALLSCGSISVDVRTYSSFSSSARFRPYDGNGNYAPNTIYDPGVQGSVVVVTGLSLQPVMFPMLNAFFSTAGSGKVVVSAAAVFRNEPY